PMSPRPRFTSKIDQIRNAVVGVILRPLRWFSPATQFVIGFGGLSILTTFVLTWWPYTYRAIAVFAAVVAAYFMVWRFVKHRSASVDLLISPERAFALVGSAIFFEAAVVRFGFVVTTAIASQSNRPPFDDAAVWTFAVP